MQVGKERAKAYRHCKTEFNKQVLHVLLVDATLQTVQALQEARQQGEELLVQQLVAPCGGEGGEGKGGEGEERGGRGRGRGEGRERGGEEREKRGENMYIMSL